MRTCENERRSPSQARRPNYVRRRDHPYGRVDRGTESLANIFGVLDSHSDNFNVFDGTVVTISIVEMIVAEFVDIGGGGGAISSLRAVRLLRVFKLARSWTSFRELLAKMIVTLNDIQFFAALMLLFMCIFTLLCMEIFAFKVKFDDDDHSKPIYTEDPNDGVYPRANFNDFF